MGPGKGPGKGVCPVGIADSFARLEAKCVLFVCGDEAKGVRGAEQLRASLKAGIEGGGIHAACLPWQTHEAEEDWGFLLVNAKNVFDEASRMNVLDRPTQMAIRGPICT